MKLENEREEKTVIFDVELSDLERNRFLEYAKKNITDDALIQFAILDSLEKQFANAELEKTLKDILSFCENLAELGCPRHEDADMWFRELTKHGQLEVVEHLKEIMRTRITI